MMMSATTSGPSGAINSSLATTPRRQPRRVAEASRRRSAQSSSGHGCTMCQRQGVECSYKLPRKTRFYGSLDDLSDRFKCLEAIVRGAFPDDAISTVPELLRLGERMGYAMPDTSQENTDSPRTQDLVKSLPNPSAAGTLVGTSSGSFTTSTSTKPRDSAELLGSETLRHSPTIRPGPERAAELSKSNRVEPLGLIRDTTGQEHFIGPSGSLQFLSQVRKLLQLRRGSSNSNNAHPASPPGVELPPRLASSAFTDEDAAQALETDGNQNELQEQGGQEAEDGLRGSSSVITAADGEQQEQQGGQTPATTSSCSPFSKVTAAIDAGDVETIVGQLPPRPVLDALLRTYFKHVHPDFPLFHRGTFEEEYESFLFQRRPNTPNYQHFQHPHFSHTPPIHHHNHPTYYNSHSHQNPPPRPCAADPGWLGCLHMMIAFASLFPPFTTATTGPTMHVNGDVDPVALRRRCVALTRYRLLPHLVSRCTLANLRALLLLALFLHNHNERNAAWNLVGTALRAAFAMGLHRPVGEAHFRPVEREVRRRVFCTLFGFEQFLASSLGRPSGLPFRDSTGAEQMEVVPPRREVLDGDGQADEDDEAVGGLALTLQTILARATASIAANTGADAADAATAEEKRAGQEQSVQAILGELGKWRRDISNYRLLNIPFISETDDDDVLGFTSDQGEPHMALQDLKAMLSWQSRPRLRTTLVLQLQYRYIAIMVTRASLLQAVASAGREAHPNGHVESLDTTSESSPSSSSLHPPPPHGNGRAGIDTTSLSDTCVLNAVQLCRLMILSDSLGLTNGISAMDVFYVYCGVMVLILRLLGRPFYASINTDGAGQGSLAATTEAGEREKRYQHSLRQLIARTREILLRVEKCSTMQRFAHVVAMFEEGAQPDLLINTGSRTSRHNGNNAAAGHTDTATAAPSTGSTTGIVRSQPSRAAGISHHPHAPPPAPQGPSIHVNNGLASGLGSTMSSTAYYNTSPLPPASGSQVPREQQQPQHQVAAPSAFADGFGSATWGLSVAAENFLFQQPNLLTLFEGEPEETDWAIMDTFLGSSGDGVNEPTAAGSWGAFDSLYPRNLGNR